MKRVYARATKSAAGLAVTVWLVACTPVSPPSEGSQEKPASVCAKEGQNCEYSPGKIGLCTASVEGCEGGACLTCMSLH